MVSSRISRKFLQRALLAQIFFCVWLMVCYGGFMADADMSLMDDSQLSGVSGQALLNADKITPGGTAPAVDSGLTFYRMSLDATVAFNANIDRLQLGCGGINNYIVTGCDVDMSYVSFMGSQATGVSTGAVVSDFTLTQPYVELAISGDGTSNRQVVGFNLGSQSALGYISVGRTYTNGQYNEENQVTCNTNNPITCNSGINTISGYLNSHFSGTVPLYLNWAIVNEHDSATFDTTLPISGTRLSTVHASSTELHLYGSFLTSLISSGYADLTESLRMIHGFAVNGGSSTTPTANFGISFQRQQVAYPTYDKTGYDSTANTGWWFNVPSVQITGIQGAEVAITSFTQLTSSLGTPGISQVNINLNQLPSVNCYGAAKFC